MTCATPIPSALIAPESEARLVDYRHLHAHPELSGQEHETGAYVSAALRASGFEVFKCGGTGVVGVLRNGEGQTVAYRADMDGLPVQENADLEWASRATGVLDGASVPVMHACGHDLHMVIALGVARWFAQSPGQWDGTLVLVFQPAEETAAGARAMVADGLWDRAPHPQVVLGQHVMPLPYGEVHIAPGAVMSQADALRVTVYGKGAHGSQPEHGIDPIVLGAMMITRLQTVVSREMSPRDAVVLTVGTFRGGLKENVIPDVAEFTVNLRTFSATARARALEATDRIIRAEAKASAAPDPLIEELYAFPLCDNDPIWAERIAGAIAASSLALSVVHAEPRMSSEDVAVLGAAVGAPTVYWFLGGSDTAEIAAGVAPVNHSASFVPDPDRTIDTGVSAAVAAIRYALLPSTSPSASTKGS
jgi:hippurate hydrolase